MTTSSASAPVRSAAGVQNLLLDLEKPCWVVRTSDGVGMVADEVVASRSEVLGAVGPLSPQSLGDSTFRGFHGVRSAYAAGAMANGISSPEMVIALARAGALASYGAAGVVPARIDAALAELAGALGDTPYACNLIHSPTEPALERAIVDACLRHRVRCIEASAFMDLSPEVVRYRLAGLSQEASGRITRAHRVIAKVSRVEVAEKFLRPAPAALVRTLVERGQITAEQARLGERVP
ncbi:MAG: 2-nitropropane dioxygenase, partial [Rhodococcus sp. (in: high G+C Gram-positive bacteria)]